MEPILVKPNVTFEQYKANVERINLRDAQEAAAKKAAEDADLTNKTFDLLLKHETIGGKINTEPYRDSKKNWTIGIGTLIGDGSDAALKASPYYNKSIDEATAKALADKAIKDKLALSKRLIGPETFDKFSPDLKAHIVSGAYRGDITGSPKTLNLLKQNDFQNAALEYLNNKEYKDAKKAGSGVAARMEETAAIIKKEKAPSFQSAVEDRLNQTALP